MYYKINDCIFYSETKQDFESVSEDEYLEYKSPTQQQLNETEINTLKQYLQETDYKIIKNFETGEEIPDDIKQKRMEARMRINELEKSIE